MLALTCMCLESRDKKAEKLSGASTFRLFAQDAKISLAQIILGERTTVFTSVSVEKSRLKEIS